MKKAPLNVMACDMTARPLKEILDNYGMLVMLKVKAARRRRKRVTVFTDAIIRRMWRETGIVPAGAFVPPLKRRRKK